MEWKKQILEQIGLASTTLTARDWILLMLLADDRRPMVGEESLHIAFFMMQVPPFSFKPLLFSVYSSELHRALEELMEEGLVRRSVSFERGRAVESIALTDKGALEAYSLAEKVRKTWVLVGELVIREGSKILGELEALKKTYNGKDLNEWIKLFLDRIDNPESLFDLWFSKDEIEYMKKIYSQFKRVL